ncbi:MAG TPA: corrinoid protein [Candidatus Sumerlaeota bacterium]|nr:corrinoid protein [Candidatus Sumerlaeota bacterium]HOR28875.1 corrinoid protein [Candidatus Sumerlaeota bacterium]
MSENKLKQLRICIERGKGTQAAPYPPDMKDQPGARELTEQLLAEGVAAEKILNEALIPGMREVGRKFQNNEAFVPDMLISADAMKKAMALLKTELANSNVEPKGTFIVGTVQGDMHDIGKNLVAMMVEGAGWEVIDLGVDVSADKFLNAVEQHPKAAVGMSALLTTTMGAMKTTVEKIRAKFPNTTIIIGGAPVTDSFAKEIKASGYAPDPQGAIELLEGIAVA